MKKLQIIGIGNRIMEDDGIGVYVVEQLIEEQFLYNIESVAGKADISIEYIVGETDIAYCVNSLDAEGCVVIIDAAISGKEPGTITEFKINDISLCTSMTLNAHNYNLIEAARMTLNQCNFIIIGIEPELVDYQWGLSDTLNIAFPHIVEGVKKCILKLAALLIFAQ